MLGGPYDSLSESLAPYQRKHVLIAWDGLRVKAYVLDFMHPEDMGQDYGGWVLEVDQIVEDAAGRTVNGVRPEEGKPMAVSLYDPPLTIHNMEGDVIWSR